MPAAHPVAERLQGGRTQPWWRPKALRFQARLENLTVWEMVLVKVAGRAPRHQRDGLPNEGDKDAQSAPEGPGKMDAGIVGDQVINTKNSNLAYMCESLERRITTKDLPYDLEEPGDERDITRGLMRLSQRALSKYVDNEPDLY